MNILYWLNNKNILIKVEGHYKLFDNKFIEKYKKENYYDMLAKQGYLRLVETGDELIICYNNYNNITDSKINFLKNFCIEKGIKLLVEIAPVLQKPGYTLREIT